MGVFALCFDFDKKAINDFCFEEGEDIEIMYWRKNRHLHNWMERLWEKKVIKANKVMNFDKNKYVD